MGLLRLLSGKPPEAHEQKGDLFCERREYGLAKTEYEVALHKLAKKPGSDAGDKRRLDKKLLDAKENLARMHKKEGDQLVEVGMHAEAEELFGLAAALTQDRKLAAEIEKKRDEIRRCFAEAQKIEMIAAVADEEAEQEIQTDDDERFRALVNALPETEKRAYQSYGEHFKTGYLALHSGDFEAAAAHLLQAREECREENSYISFELAGAQLNLGRIQEARALLEGFLSEHPGSLKAYGLMCEVLWEAGEFDKARKFLHSCPADISGSAPITVLKGETCFKEKKFREAAALYLDALESRGWNEQIARFLAKAYEALDAPGQARDVYAKILGTCQGCGCRPDPFILQRYAETSFLAGDYSTKILEIYLELTREDPASRLHYFEQISKIYSRLGNEKEARRFLSFAKG